MIYGLISLFIFGGFFASRAEGQTSNKSVETILETYVEDFQNDTAAETARVFGIKITGVDRGDWSVVVSGEKDTEGRWGVKLKKGFPTEPTFYYALSSKTLASLDAGSINGLTVQGKAFSSDIAPMAVEFMKGVKKFDVNPFSFHFWTRGFPEKVDFRTQETRNIHSADMGVFYYQKGFRSAWSILEKGQGANNGPGKPIMAPFPTMVIITKGSVKGKVKGKLIEAVAGEMIFIPPMTPHEWWNENEETTEALLIFFGEGA